MMKPELINVHWFKRAKLNTLLDDGVLYRGRGGTTPIKSGDELTGQIVRKSVWVAGYYVGDDKS